MGKAPLEIREARLNALLRALGDAGLTYPASFSVPGDGRFHPAINVKFQNRAELRALVADARLKLVADGIRIERDGAGRVSLSETAYCDAPLGFWPDRGRATSFLARGRQRGWLDKKGTPVERLVGSVMSFFGRRPHVASKPQD